MKFLAVAEAGKIGAAAERLAIAQPALTRTIARLEARFGARLFERLPTGVRPTALGETAVELARGLLREIDAAAEKFDAVIRGRTGSYRITASSMWMEAVLAPAVDAFSARLPGIELTLRTAPFGDALQLLANGDSDLHCGGMDTDEPLPAFLRRERFLDITAGIVAHEDHPLLAAKPTAGDLAAWPWIDYGAPVYTAPVPISSGGGPSSLDRLLDGLFRDTYQWIRVDANGTSNPVDVGTDDEDYTLVAADEGKRIKVKVTFTDDDANAEELTSDAYPTSSLHSYPDFGIPPARTACPAGNDWCATMTVGYASVSGIGVHYGFSASPSHGALDDTSFDHDGSAVTVEAVGIRKPQASLDYPDLVTGSESLELHHPVGSQTFAFEAANTKAANYRYWNNSGLSWSAGEAVALSWSAGERCAEADRSRRRGGDTAGAAPAGGRRPERDLDGDAHGGEPGLEQVRV